MASMMMDAHFRPTALDADEAESSDASMAPAPADGFRGSRRIAAAVFGVGLVGIALLTALAGSSGRTVLRKGSTSSAMQLSKKDTVAELGKELFDSHQDLFDFDGAAIQRSSSVAQEAMANAPQENMHDGNICDDDEEFFAKLCYKKCSLLTHGKYPKRTSAWSCCASDDGKKGGCGLFNQKLTMRICAGFDVSGDRAGNGCPHPAGACLENEEVHLGRCFKKCSELTNGMYPSRVAAATCCKAEVGEEWKCLDLMNVKTRKEFNVGGGAGDGDKRTPRRPHWPQTAVTEAKE
jgi:hypothetical protein